MALFYFSPLRKHISFDYIQQSHETWKAYTTAHPILSACIFLSILTFSSCLVIPDTLLLGILAGFLFPLPLAMLYICIGETIGAYLFYEAMRLALIPPLHKRKKAFIWSLEKKIQANQVSYLLFFRLTHLLPFWLINLAAACFEIPRYTFAWTTCVGLIPLAYILAQGGAGLGTFFDTHTTFSLSAVFNDRVTAALIVLGIFALIPLLWKIVKRKKAI